MLLSMTDYICQFLGLRTTIIPRVGRALGTRPTSGRISLACRGWFRPLADCITGFRHSRIYFTSADLCDVSIGRIPNRVDGFSSQTGICRCF